MYLMLWISVRKNQRRSERERERRQAGRQTDGEAEKRQRKRMVNEQSHTSPTESNTYALNGYVPHHL